MNKFKPIGISIPKFLLGTKNNGILPLKYNEAQYLDILELMKREDPKAYNLLLIKAACAALPHSEIVHYIDSEGRLRAVTNVKAGSVSGTDPILKLLVEGVLLNKPLLWIGKGLYSLISKVRYSLPSSKSNYYRLLTDLSDGDTAEAALLDIIKTGVIRANPKGTTLGGTREHFIGPYFSKGRPYSPELNRRAKVAIVGKERPEVDYLQIDPHQSQLITGKSGSLFTPLVNGVPNQSPSKYFEIWKRGENPISKHFWFKLDIPNSAPDPALFKYPNGSNIMVHMDYGNSLGAFTSKGAYIKEGFLNPGPSESLIGHTWFNKEKPYALGVNKKPFTRAIVGMRENIPGLIRVRDSKTPLGLWNGKSGLVLNSEYATPEMINMEKMLEFLYSPKYKRFKLITNDGN